MSIFSGNLPGLCHWQLPDISPHSLSHSFIQIFLNLLWSSSFPTISAIIILPFYSLPYLAIDSLRPPGIQLHLLDLCQIFLPSSLELQFLPSFATSSNKLLANSTPTQLCLMLSNDRKVRSILQHQHPLPTPASGVDTEVHHILRIGVSQESYQHFEFL